jgi:uncharacterized protein YegL
MRVISVLLDKSGSMWAEKDETIKAYNDYLDQITEDDVWVILTLFDSVSIEMAHTLAPHSGALRLNDENYIPGGITPLFDAIAHAIRHMEVESRNLEVAKGVVPSVLFLVVTDGQENDSREYDLERIQKYMGDVEKSKGWEFAYLGVGPEGWSASNLAAYGQTQSAARGQMVSSSGTQAAFGAAKGITQSYLSRNPRRDGGGERQI